MPEASYQLFLMWLHMSWKWLAVKENTQLQFKVVLPFDLSVPAREARDTCMARVAEPFGNRRTGTHYLTSYY